MHKQRKKVKQISSWSQNRASISTHVWIFNAARSTNPIIRYRYIDCIYRSVL